MYCVVAFMNSPDLAGDRSDACDTNFQNYLWELPTPGSAGIQGIIHFQKTFTQKPVTSVTSVTDCS